MEDEDFLDLSIEDRENKLTIFKEEMGSLGNLDYRPAGGVENLAGILGKGVTSDIFQEASIWANTSKTNRYESGDELNSKFPNLFPELEGKQFPTYEVKNGAVNVLDQQVNPENAEGKWGKIQSAIDKGTNMYANQEIDGVISDPGLMPEGSDEDVKKNLIQYGQVMALTDPKYKQRYAGQDSPFEDPKSAFQFTKQARNFQGTKFKVNALRYVAANYDKNLYSYVDKNADFFTYMPELRDDEEFMKMYKSHEDMASKYHDHLKANFGELYSQDGRDYLQTARLSGDMGLIGNNITGPGYIDTSIMVGLGGLVESVGNFTAGAIEFFGKHGDKLNPGLLLANSIGSSLSSDETNESLAAQDIKFDREIEEVADNVSHFFSSDNWKETALGQYANIPDQVAGASLADNPMYILPMTLKTVGEMVPALVATAYSGGGTLVAGTIMGGDQFFKSYHQTNKEARELGVDPEDAEALSLSIGAVTGITGAVFNNPLARRGAAAMMGIRNKATTEAVKTLASSGSRQAAVKAGTKAYIKEVGSEELEEIFQGGFENYQKYKYDQRSPEPVYGVDKFMGKEEFVNTVILTATATTLMASPNLGISSSQLEKEAWTTAGLDLVNFESSIEKELKRKNPKFSKETAEGMKEKARQYEKIVTALKDAGTPMDQMVELANVEYNALKTPEPEGTPEQESAVETKKKDIKSGIPQTGAIVDGSKVVSIIQNVGDSKTDKELKDKLDNIDTKSFKMQRVSLETLYETNKEFKNFVDENPDLEYDGKNKNAPAVIDEQGSVLDGMKRMAAAYNRGQKQIRVFNEQEIKISKEEQIDADKELDQVLESLSPKPTTKVEDIDPETGDVFSDIKKLANHFQRVFKGSAVELDQDAFNKRAQESGLDPGKTKGFRDRNTNEIFINPELATLDTPIHEFAHIWEDMLAEKNPEAHKKAMSLIKGTKFHKDAIKSGYGDRALNEALVQAIGEKSAKIFKDPKRQSEFDKVVAQVKEMIRTALNLPSDADFDIQTSSLNALINSSADKIMSATNIETGSQSATNIETDSQRESIDIESLDLKKYNADEREAVKVFKNVKENLGNDPTQAELTPVIEDGKYKFEKQGKKLKVKIATQSYNMVNGLDEYFEGTLEDKVDQIGDKIVDEYNANSTVEEVIKGMGWYKDLHIKMRNIFGSRTNFFGRLIGATSAQTDVKNNYKYAIGALKGYSNGAYDSYVEEYKEFIDRVEQFENEEELNQFFNEWKGRAINTAKNLGQKTGIFNPEPDPKDINATKRKLLNMWPKANVLYRTDNPSLRYGINSPATAKVLAGIWLKQTQQTKTNNFYKNVVGLTTNPTIDVWAARTIRRMIYKGNIDRYRIPERAEAGVSESTIVNKGNISDYRLAEEVIINASEKLGIDPDDLQAYLWFAEKDLWMKEGWSKGTAAKKGDFRDESSQNQISRYYLGLSTERTNYDDPVLDNQDKQEMLEQEAVSIEKDLRDQNLVSLKVNTTKGQYFTDTEISFDAEMIVESGQDMTPVWKRAVESAKKHEQDDVFLSEVLPIDERMDTETMGRELMKKPNFRPAVELQFKNPISFDEAIKFSKENLDKEGVQIGPIKTDISGYTFMTNEAGDKVLGIKYQFVPEFTFKKEDDITDENMNQARVDWANNAKETELNLKGNENVLYFYNHYVDSFVAHKGQYNEILNNIDNGSKDIFKGDSKTRTKEYFQSKGRSGLESETSSNIDEQRNPDGADRSRFSGTVPTDDGGQISGASQRRIDQQKLPDRLSQYLSALNSKGADVAKLLYGIKAYSQRVDGKELSTEEARIVLSEFMDTNGMRQRGFETNSITKSKNDSPGNQELYDWVNENPNYYKTMDMKETMEFVIDEIEGRGGFDDATVVQDLTKGNTTLEESARVQFARMAALKHYGQKITQLRSDGASNAEVDAAIAVMAKIEKALATDGTYGGRGIAALRSWTSQTPQSLVDKIEREMEKHNEAIENPDRFTKFLSKIFGGGKKLETTTLTADQRAKIEELHSLLSEAPENSEVANAAMRSMYKYVDTIAPVASWQDTFWGLQYAALLSGASTQILNVGSGTANIVLQPLMEMARIDRIFTGGYFDFIRKARKGTVSKGMSQGSALFMDIWQNGSRVDKYSSDAEQDINDQVAPGKYNTLETKKFKELKVGGRDLNPFNQYKMVGRLLNGTDRFISKVGYEGRYYNYLIDQLRKDGVPKKEIFQKASDLYLATEVKQKAQDEANALMQKLQKADPETNWDNISKLRARELMHEALVVKYSEDFVNKTDSELLEMMKKNDPVLHGRLEEGKMSIQEYKEYLIAIKTDDMNGVSEDANTASNSQVFIDDRQGIAHPIAATANLIRQYANKTYQSEWGNFANKLVIKSFVPFTNIIGSIGEYLIDTTPFVGLARAYIAEDGMGPKKSRMREEQLSRGYFGTMSFLGLAAMVAAAYNDDDDDPFVEVSGGGYNNPSQYTRSQMKNAPMPPYSVKIGGEVFDYRNIVPLAIPLAIIGNYMETFKTTGGKGEIFDDAMNRGIIALANSSNLLMDSSVMTAMNEFLESTFGAATGLKSGLTYDGGKVGVTPIDKKSNAFATSLVRSIGGTLMRPMPQNANLFRQATKIYDANSYSAGDVKNALIYASGLYQIPGVGQPKIDVFGENAKSYPGETVIPYTHWMDLRGKDSRWAFIDKHNAYPGKIQNRPFYIGTEMTTLSPEQLYVHQKSTGVAFNELLRGYMSNASDEDLVLLKRGKSSSIHRKVIMKLYTVAQNVSKANNNSKWAQENEKNR
jgi:hypothetical protein